MGVATIGHQIKWKLEGSTQLLTRMATGIEDSLKAIAEVLLTLPNATVVRLGEISVRPNRVFRMRGAGGGASLRLGPAHEQHVIVRCRPNTKGGGFEFFLRPSGLPVASLHIALASKLQLVDDRDEVVEEEAVDAEVAAAEPAVSHTDLLSVLETAKLVVAERRQSLEKIAELEKQFDESRAAFLAEKDQLDANVKRLESELDALKHRRTKLLRSFSHDSERRAGELEEIKGSLAEDKNYVEAKWLLDSVGQLLNADL